jgi:diguanylate cyclase (GGDEF)-like protein
MTDVMEVLASRTADVGVPTRWFSRLVVLGVTVTMFSLAVDLTPDANRTMLLWTTPIGYVAAAVLALLAHRIAPWMLAGIAVPAGVLQIAGGVVASGDPANPAAAFFIAVLLYSAYLFTWPVLLAHLALAGAAYGGALLAVTTPAEALDRWMFLITTVGLSAMVVARLRDRLVAQAETDPLTGVLNRRAFDAELGAVLARGGRAAVLLVDVDDLKTINDTAGHEAGDEALRRVADALVACADRDRVARLGGDELAVVVTGPDVTAAPRCAREIRRRLAEDPAGGPTVSIGIASAPEAGATAPALLAAADAALYRAKRAGKDRSVVAA